MRHRWLVHLLVRTVKSLEDDPHTQIRVHKFFVVFWLCNMVAMSLAFFLLPGLWLAFSVFYLVFISLYSNFATDYDALSASQASLHGIESRDQATEISRRLSTVEAKVADLENKEVHD